MRIFLYNIIAVILIVGITSISYASIDRPNTKSSVYTNDSSQISYRAVRPQDMMSDESSSTDYSNQNSVTKQNKFYID